MRLSSSLEENIQRLDADFQNCGDVVKRRFEVGKGKGQLYMLYIDNIISNDAVQSSIMTNVMNRCEMTEQTGALDALLEGVITIGEVKKVTTIEEVEEGVLLGDTLLLMEGNDFALQATTKQFPTRGVGTAQTEVVVQGPKDAFTELLSFNIVLIRRRIRDVRLKVKRKKIGLRSKGDAALMYLEDIVRPGVLETVERQLEQMDTDALLDSGYAEQLLEPKQSSPFPLLQMTERPDKASAALMEGRIVLVLDNTPFVILLPTTMHLFFQAAEDYYDRWQMMSFLRVIRYLAAFLAVALPGLYIAMVAFHPQMLPAALALKIAATRNGIPLSVVTEVILMEGAFELLREAGIRLPSPVSSTIGIVGGIIIGSAAVEAGIVSPMVVILSSLTGICTFVIPNPSLVTALRLVKYPVILLSAIWGLFGLWVGLFLLLVHLAGLKSYGIPYLYPFCAASVEDYTELEDSIVRFPLTILHKRSIFAKDGGKTAQKGGKQCVFRKR